MEKELAKKQHNLFINRCKFSVMRTILSVLVFILCLSSCKSSKRTHYKSRTSTNKHSVIDNHSTIPNKTLETRQYKAEQIIDFAKNFEGVKYKWGGTTRAGMDCSGLVFESFKAHDILLPRVSRDMAKRGKKISLKQVTKGDLLFFITSKGRHNINHVGLVVSTNNNSIEFIHVTTKLGVIISNLNESYWSKTFKEARKIL